MALESLPRQGGKLHYTNRGPLLVLPKTGPMTHKIIAPPPGGAWYHACGQINTLLPKLWRRATAGSRLITQLDTGGTVYHASSSIPADSSSRHPTADI